MSGTLTVKVKEGRNLIACDKNGSSDPYCIVSYGSTTKKTKPRKKTLFPDWSDTESFVFSVDHHLGDVLFEIFNSSGNFLASHKRMGRAKYPLREVEPNSEQHKWLQLVPIKEKDEVSGDIHVTLQYNKEDSVSSMKQSGEKNQMSASMPRASLPNDTEHPLFNYIRLSNLLEVRDICKDPKIDINMKDKYGYTPLHAACCVFSENDDEVLSLLLQQKGVDVNARNNDNNVPLHYFCAKFLSPNCTDPFELFVEKGADVNAKGANGETPLHKAIFNNQVRVLMTSLLIKAGANPNITNDRGEIPLHYAVRLGREDLVTILLKGGSDINVAGETTKSTPLDLAMEARHEKMIHLLQRAVDLYNWLAESSLNMEKYYTEFIKEDLYKELIPDLNEEILNRMNITTTGHRLRLLKAAKHLAAEMPRRVVPASPETETILTVGTGTSIEEDSGKTAQPSALDIEQQLENLKYINKGSWILGNSDCEFTVKLGSGASGTVYKGLFRDKEVAIKVLKTEQSQKELEEFKKEFQIMSTIQSPYIVFFFGAVLEPKLCMVMELCELGSLYHVMNDPKIDFDWGRVLNMSKQMTKGIDCLHTHKPQILHRDFKSLNIMVNTQLMCKVGDFGLSRFNTDTQKETLAKMRGTFAYCAPEVYRGEPFSTAADIFSLGIVLWELVVRCIKREYQRPYQEFPNLCFDFQIIIQTAKKGLRPTIPPSTPEDLADLMRRCWAPDTSTRPDCASIITTLEKLEEQYKGNPTHWKSLIDPSKE